MNGHPEEYGISCSIGESHTSTYPESIEECMSKYRNKTHNSNMVIMFMWVFMTVISMCMIMMMGSENAVAEAIIRKAGRNS